MLPRIIFFLFTPLPFHFQINLLWFWSELSPRGSEGPKQQGGGVGGLWQERISAQTFPPRPFALGSSSFPCSLHQGRCPTNRPKNHRASKGPKNNENHESALLPSYSGILSHRQRANTEPIQGSTHARAQWSRPTEGQLGRHLDSATPSLPGCFCITRGRPICMDLGCVRITRQNQESKSEGTTHLLLAIVGHPCSLVICKSLTLLTETLSWQNYYPRIELILH